MQLRFRGFFVRKSLQGRGEKAIFAFRMKTGFDNNKYLQIQSEQIKKRISQFGDKLYLEFGGKLFDDHHASRVLP